MAFMVNAAARNGHTHRIFLKELDELHALKGEHICCTSKGCAHWAPTKTTTTLGCKLHLPTHEVRRPLSLPHELAQAS